MSSTAALCSALQGYHAFTRYDCTGALKGREKVKGLKVVETGEPFPKPFSKLGESWEVNKEVMKELERTKRTKNANTLQFTSL